MESPFKLAKDPEIIIADGTGTLFDPGSIPSREAAQEVNQSLERQHLILSSMIDVVDLTLKGRLAEEIDGVDHA